MNEEKLEIVRDYGVEIEALRDEVNHLKNHIQTLTNLVQTLQQTNALALGRLRGRGSTEE